MCYYIGTLCDKTRANNKRIVNCDNYNFNTHSTVEFNTTNLRSNQGEEDKREEKRQTKVSKQSNAHQKMSIMSKQ